MKGCTTFLLFLLLFIVLNSFLLLNLFSNTLLHKSSYKTFIDKIDLEEVLDVIFDEAITKNLDENREEGNSEEISSLENDVEALRANITEEDQKLIRSKLKILIDEAFEYLQNENKTSISVDISDTKERIMDLLLDSFDINERMDLPVPVCADNVTGFCIPRDDFEFLVFELIEQDLTRAEIIETLPVCSSPGETNCFDEEFIDKILEMQDEGNFTSDNYVIEYTPNEKGIDNAKQAYAKMETVQIVLILSIIGILALVLLINRSRSFKLISIFAFLETIVLVFMLLGLFYIDQVIIEKIQESIELDSQYLYTLVDIGVNIFFGRAKLVIAFYAIIMAAMGLLSSFIPRIRSLLLRTQSKSLT